MHVDVITKESLETSFKEKMDNGIKVYPKHAVDVVETSFGSSIPKSGEILDNGMLARLNSLKSLSRGGRISLSGKYDNGLDFVFGNRGSINERIAKGAFSGGNTLNDNWTDLFDAIRLDLTIRKEAKQTIRQFIYDEIFMPNATKDVRPSELYPYGVVFEENNGEGQAVRQGANLGGKYDTVPMKLYAAGFTWTLLAELFDGSYDLSRLTDGVAVGYSAKKDDLAIKPILDATYTGDAATAASTVGSNRQEKLMNTLMDALDDIGKRVDPTTKRKISPTELVILGTETDIRHIQHVMTGLGNSTPEKYTALKGIKKLVAYDGEVINMPNETVTYGGCTEGVVHIIKPNRYFKIPIKRNLTMEIDKTPDVNTLAREQRAWYFSESIFNDVGIANFVQKVTLSAW